MPQNNPNPPSLRYGYGVMFRTDATADNPTPYRWVGLADFIRPVTVGQQVVIGGFFVLVDEVADDLGFLYVTQVAARRDEKVGDLQVFPECPKPFIDYSK